MKVSVTRPDALHNPFAPPRPLVVDTDALSPHEAAQLGQLAAAARAEPSEAAPGGQGLGRPDLGLEIVIEDGGEPARIAQSEGSLTPAAAALVDAVARLAR